MSKDLAPLAKIPTGKYRHYKGNVYEVLGVIRHSETLENLVLYKALYGNSEVWIRPIFSFWELVHHDDIWQPRFTPIS